MRRKDDGGRRHGRLHFARYVEEEDEVEERRERKEETCVAAAVAALALSLASRHVCVCVRKEEKEKDFIIPLSEELLLLINAGKIVESFDFIDAG